MEIRMPLGGSSNVDPVIQYMAEQLSQLHAQLCRKRAHMFCYGVQVGCLKLFRILFAVKGKIMQSEQFSAGFFHAVLAGNIIHFHQKLKLLFVVISFNRFKNSVIAFRPQP